MSYENLRLQFPRGITAENNAYTAQIGEFTIDIEKWEVRVHDGITPGGFVIGGKALVEKVLSIMTGAQRNSVISVHGQVGVVNVTKDDIGLGNVDNVKQVPATRTITAGNGLTGGGNLNNDITINVGIPTSLSGTTLNAVTTDSHTHQLSVTASRNESNTDILLLAKALKDHIDADDHSSTYLPKTGGAVTGNLGVMELLQTCDEFFAITRDVVNNEDILSFGVEHGLEETSKINGAPAKLSYNNTSGYFALEISENSVSVGDVINFIKELQINKGSISAPVIFESNRMYEAGRRVSVAKTCVQDGVLFIKNDIEDCSISFPLGEPIYPGPTVGVYYGGNNNTTIFNTTTRIDSSGALIGSETSVGTSRQTAGGAGLIDNCIYYAGATNTTLRNTVTRINQSGLLVASETSIGLARAYVAGANIENLGIYYGGTFFYANVNTVTRIDPTGIQIGSETTAGTSREGISAAGLDTVGVYYGGNSYDFSFFYSKITRINSSGVIVGSETNSSLISTNSSGAAVSNYGIYYAGRTSQNRINTVTRIDSNGVQVGSETNVGTARYGLAGASIGDYGCFYGGGYVDEYTYQAVVYNKVTRIDSAGALVGSETTLGVGRMYLSGASI